MDQQQQQTPSAKQFWKDVEYLNGIDGYCYTEMARKRTTSGLAEVDNEGIQDILVRLKRMQEFMKSITNGWH